MDHFCLIADVGGTNTRVGAIRLSAHAQDDWYKSPIEHIESHRNSEYDCVEDILESWLNRHANDLDRNHPLHVRLAIAAPIQDGPIQLTNLHWVLDTEKIASLLQRIWIAPVEASMINDFVALAWSLPSLSDDDKSVLQEGGSASYGDTGLKLVLGPGTGLGVAALCPLPSGGWQALPSQGGHIALPIHTQEEMDIRAFIADLHDITHVSAERILSGTGLVHLYQAICHNNNAPIAFHTASMITEAGLSQSDDMASRAIRQFTVWLMRVAGELSMTMLPSGGIYLGGGITPHLLPLLKQDFARRAFLDMGRMDMLVSEYPFSVITKTHPALLGLALNVSQFLSEDQES